MIGFQEQPGARQQALARHFNRAYRRGWWFRLWSALRRRPARLLDLAAIVHAHLIRGEHFAGRQTVPISQIRGSEGRRDAFTAAFNPRQTHTAERWRQVARAWLDGIELAPVELIQVGEVYFVRDGHHRISVATTFGQREIDAVVTAWEVDDPLTPIMPARGQAVPVARSRRRAENRDAGAGDRATGAYAGSHTCTGSGVAAWCRPCLSGGA